MRGKVRDAEFLAALMKAGVELQCARRHAPEREEIRQGGQIGIELEGRIRLFLLEVARPGGDHHNARSKPHAQIVETKRLHVVKTAAQRQVEMGALKFVAA